MLTRRSFLATSTAAVAAASLSRAFAAEPAVKIRVGACVVGFDDAKKAGLEGVELNVGGAADVLPIADPKVRQQHKDKMKETGLACSSFMMGLLNSNPLATDPRGPAWLEQSIDAAKDLGASVILVAFFGKGNLLDGQKQLKKAEADSVVARIKAAAPRAKDAGVILGIENYLSARQNAEILDRINHDAVKVYYDVRNTTDMGYDIPAEIRFLKDRIAIFHFKDGPNYLGEGKVKYPPIADAIRDIGYKGWIVLETSCPSKDRVADTKRNADFTRKLFA